MQRHRLVDGHEALEFLEPVLDHDDVLRCGRYRCTDPAAASHPNRRLSYANRFPE